MAISAVASLYFIRLLLPGCVTAHPPCLRTATRRQHAGSCPVGQPHENAGDLGQLNVSNLRPSSRLLSRDALLLHQRICTGQVTHWRASTYLWGASTPVRVIGAEERRRTGARLRHRKLIRPSGTSPSASRRRVFDWRVDLRLRRPNGARTVAP